MSCRKRFVLIIALTLSGACKERVLNKPEGRTNPDRPVSVRSSGESRERERLVSSQHSILDTNLSEELRSKKIKEVSTSLRSMSTNDLVDLVKSLDPKSGKEASSLLYEAINVLAERDPQEALKVAESLPQNFRNPSFFARIATTDPQAALKWIVESGSKNQTTRLMALQSMHELVRANSDAALNFLANADQAVKTRLGPSILGTLAKTDFSRALQEAQKLPPEMRTEVLKSVISGGASSDPMSAFLEVSKSENTEISSSVYPNIFLKWFEQDAIAAGRSLEKLSGSDIQVILTGRNGNLSKLINADVDLAVAALNKVVFTEANAGIFASAVREIAQKDVSKAQTWLEDFPESSRKGDLIKEIAIIRASEDPSLLVPEILKNQESYRTQVITGLATVWGEKDSTEALKFALSLPVIEQQLFASSVLSVVIKSNPEVAAGYISQNLMPSSIRHGDSYSDSIKSVGSSYATSNLKKSVEWSNSLNSKDRESAVSGIASVWVQRDPNAASEWITGLPEGPIRKAAVLSLVSQIESSDPESARRWKESVR